MQTNSIPSELNTHDIDWTPPKVSGNKNPWTADFKKDAAADANYMKTIRLNETCRPEYVKIGEKNVAMWKIIDDVTNRQNRRIDELNSFKNRVTMQLEVLSRRLRNRTNQPMDKMAEQYVSTLQRCIEQGKNQSEIDEEVLKGIEESEKYRLGLEQANILDQLLKHFRENSGSIKV